VIESSDPAGLVFRIAGFGLPGHEDGEEPLSVSAESCTSLLGFISRHRISGLAVAALQADWLQLPPEYERDLLARHREAMVGALAIERRLLTVADAFDDAGVQFLVLKGPAIAHSIYPDPSWREFGDLDLLVSTADWKRSMLCPRGPRAAPCSAGAPSRFRRAFREGHRLRWKR
jgi:hypothetical protein